ncbi:MAG: PEGA domain-containing protein [Acidobacteria bacterium]|nr:PEGA domain-containing protein [Acidobacteriota bacterium]
MQDKFNNRPVLYPEKMTLSAEGIPQAFVSENSITLTIRGFRGKSYLYFQVDIANDSNADFPWQSVNYRLTNEKGFAIAGVSPYEASVELARELRKPPPPPPPSTGGSTSESVTTGTIDRSGNINTRTTTTTEPDPYASGYALGTVLSAIINRGKGQREETFMQELAAFAYTDLTIRPSERQRLYLCYTYVKSKYYDLIIPAPLGEKLRFFMDKPKGTTGAPVAVSEEDRKNVPTALGATVAKEQASQPVPLAPSQTGMVSRADEATQPATAAVVPEPTPEPAPAIALPILQQTEPATVVIKSTPEGAEITIDGKFLGTTPSTARLVPGDHEIVIEKKGANRKRVAGGDVTLPAYRIWRRNLTVSSASTITIDATLEEVP